MAYSVALMYESARSHKWTFRNMWLTKQLLQDNGSRIFERNLTSILRLTKVANRNARNAENSVHYVRMG